MKLALKWFIPITLVAMGLAWVSEQVALLLGFELPSPQPIVQLFTNPRIAWHWKALYAAWAVLAAPIYEELIFRMGLFRFCRWAGRKMKKGEADKEKGESRFPLVAALVSGAVFAAVHFHAATFVPLWFLGVAFAWLYWKAETIRSSMLCHFLFNLINFALCLVVAQEEPAAAATIGAFWEIVV